MSNKNNITVYVPENLKDAFIQHQEITALEQKIAAIKSRIKRLKKKLEVGI